MSRLRWIPRSVEELKQERGKPKVCVLSNEFRNLTGMEIKHKIAEAATDRYEDEDIKTEFTERFMTE